MVRTLYPMVRTLYPQRRSVPGETVISWAQDSLINAGIDSGLTPESVMESDEYRNLNLHGAITLLEDSGEVTFAL